MTDKVDVIFSSFASRYDAKPGDRKAVPADEVAALVADGVAAPAKVSDAKEAGLEPQAAASKK